jgi:hypothetical protein
MGVFSINNENGIKFDRSLATLIAAFLLAIVHQYLFFEKLPGVSYPIFVCLFYAFMLYFAKDKLRKLNKFSYFWFGAIFLLSMTYMLFHNLFFFGLNLLVIPALILLHMTYLLSDKRPSWNKFGLFWDMMEHTVAQNLRHWGTVFKVIKRAGGSKVKDERKQVMGKVLIGLAISFPLLLVVITLLSSADGVFHHVILALPNVLDRISFAEGFVRALWIILLGMGFFGLVWGFVDSKIYDWEFQPKVYGPVQAPATFKVDPVILSTILIAINTVYVLFVVVQFSYLFGAWEGVLPEGSSYADYARSGFFELIMVAAINFVILLLALVSQGNRSGLLQKVINMLLYILVGCSTVMLYSAYTRLTLYEEVYGYTTTRFLVHAFMIFMGALLIVAALRIAVQRLPLAKCYIVLGLASYVVMNYIGMDVIIAQKNIDRYEISGKLDVDYLIRLSPEVIPSLIKFSRNEEGKLDKYLRNEWSDGAERERKRKWQSFNFPEYQAQQELEKYFTENK